MSQVTHVAAGATFDIPAYLVEDELDIITGTREKLWVLPDGNGDWEGYVANNDPENKIERYTSTDAKTWIFDQIVIDESSVPISLQDVTVVRDDDGVLGTAGTYYLVCENATTGTDVRIYTSPDGISWTFEASFSTNGPQSPAVHIRDTDAVMAFEKHDARPFQTRYATSTDGVSWTDSGVLYQSADYVVDDWFKYDGLWWMTYHVSGSGNMMLSWSETELGQYNGSLLAEPIGAQRTQVESYTIPHTASGEAYGTIDGEWIAYGWNSPNDTILRYQGSSQFIGRHGHAARQGRLDAIPSGVDSCYLAGRDGGRMIDATGGQRHATVLSSQSVTISDTLDAPVAEVSSDPIILGIQDELQDTQFTVGAVIRPDATGGQGIVSRWGPNVASQFTLRINGSGNWEAQVFDGNSVLGAEGPPITTGEFTTAFLSWDPDSGTVTLHQNGAQQASTSSSGFSLNNPDADIVAAAYDTVGAGGFDGGVAAVYYKKDIVLSDSQIAAIHNRWV